MLNKLIAKVVIKWCERRLKEVRKENPNYTTLEIKGTGKDYPNYLMFTDNERVRNEMVKI